MSNPLVGMVQCVAKSTELVEFQSLLQAADVYNFDRLGLAYVMLIADQFKEYDQVSDWLR